MKKRVVYLFVFLILLHGQQIKASSTISYKIEMLEWEEVNTLLPKYSKFTVMDLETGKKFEVQRRAGSHHADVQPLTVKDTKIMKKIYGGEWSWRRRAIIVMSEDKMIAASMHGMPHGAGALENSFPGHFCIHFYGSTTHKTNAMDLSHKLMIFKASSRLEKYFANASPYDVVSAYIAGLKQQDSKILSLTSHQPIVWKPILKKVENVRISRMPILPAEDLSSYISLDIPIEIEWFVKNIGRKTYHGEIHLVRFSTNDPWTVDSISFLEENNLIKKKHSYK
ncbi:hypothetical protein [Bacillus sp. MRMR6]|uniref:hypothetical protein n=1 Tax=Bacillus sp. MRMR6 TaxID=1928617 RepID=UPI0009512E7B|nr:hypothetical protein [Bacillus sp. MRMR6]OLS34345.1 hypothetical protein BTR25_22210 [Bacillus sp. MRMR6]